MIDRAKFFASVRNQPFGGKLDQGQVDGMNAILAEWERRRLSDLRWLAYMLGTTFWETARTMQPINERGGAAYFTRMYDIAGERPELARQNGNISAGDGARYHGRGYVQLTWRGNYRRMGELLGIPLEAQPELALDPGHAAAIMFEGMIRGTFTGKSLALYFNDHGADWLNARRIINGLDCAGQIKEIANNFYSAVKAADSPFVTLPPPPDVVPLPPPGQTGAAKPATTFWQRFINSMKG